MRLNILREHNDNHMIESMVQLLRKTNKKGIHK